MGNDWNRQALLARLAGRRAAGLLCLPDLTLWHSWHTGRGTLPEDWRADTLVGLCRRIGVPVWQTVRPWRLDHPGIRVIQQEQEEERIVRWETPSGALSARWTLGPDGGWWQAEYPVKSAADLPAAAEIVRARTYAPDPGKLRQAESEVGEEGVVAVELPMQPYPDLLHTLLGWTEGFMLLYEDPAGIAGLLALLREKLQPLVEQVARLPASLALSPDNLDAQFITPPAFEERLAAGYRETAGILHEAGKLLVVHLGGMARDLLPGLGRCGVDVLEGICSPPQSDASIEEARPLCGDGVTLWGGIPQDYLLGSYPEAEFEEAVHRAARSALQDGRSILGVADRVPAGAVPERLERLALLAAEEAAKEA